MSNSQITDLEKLNVFIERSDELFATKFIKDNKQTKIRLKFNEKTGLDYEFEEEPDEELLKSFLLSFRHFVAEKEPVFLPTIYNILQKRLPEGELKEDLKESRKRYNAAFKSAKLQLHKGKTDSTSNKIEPPNIIESKATTPKKIFDIWINGIYFHNDREKKKELETFTDWGEGLMKFNFLDCLIQVTNQISFVRVAIKEALNTHREAFN